MKQAQRSYFTQSVYKVVLQKATSVKILQLILYLSNSTGYVDGFVERFTFSKRLRTYCVCDKARRLARGVWGSGSGFKIWGLGFVVWSLGFGV